MKMGPLVFDCLRNNKSLIQKHFLALFLIKERPIGWYKELFGFMNLLHRNSFMLGDFYGTIRMESERGFVSEEDTNQLKGLVNIVVAKHKYAPKVKLTEIPKNMTISARRK